MMLRPAPLPRGRLDSLAIRRAISCSAAAFDMRLTQVMFSDARDFLMIVADPVNYRSAHG